MSADPIEVSLIAQELSENVRDIVNLWRQYPFADAWQIAPHIEGCACSLTVHEDGENVTLALLRKCPHHGVLVDAIGKVWGSE